MRLKNERKIVTKGKKKKKKKFQFFQVFKNFSHQKVLFFGDNWNCYGTQHLKECKNIEPPIYIFRRDIWWSKFWYICCENFIKFSYRFFEKLKDSTLRALPARLILSNAPTTLLGPLNLLVSSWSSRFALKHNDSQECVCQALNPWAPSRDWNRAKV